MRNPKQQNVSRDVLATAGEFVNCPATYFALRHSCRCICDRMDPVCPVTVTAFLDIWCYKDDVEDIYKHVRLVDSGSGHGAKLFLDYGFEPDKFLPHISTAVGLVDADALLSLPDRELERLLGVALSGKLPGHTRKLASAFSKHPRASWKSVPGITCVAELATCLDELTQSRQQWIECIDCAVRGGSAGCVALLLSRSGLSLTDLPDAGASAVEGGNLALVQELFRSEQDMRTVDQMLVLAATNGHLAVSRYLLDLGAGTVASVLLDALVTLIARGAMADDVALAELLVSRGVCLRGQVVVSFSENDRDGTVLNVLELAACHGRLDICHFLLAVAFPGCPADVCRRSPWAPFDPAVLELFADLDVCNEKHVYGYAITAAAGYQNIPALRFLLERGVKLDVCGGRDGHTPLTALLGEALDCEALLVVSDFLRMCPALASMPTRGGVFPMFLVERYMNRGPLMEWRMVLELLVKHGADPDKLCEPDMLIRIQPQVTYTLRPPAHADIDSASKSEDIHLCLNPESGIHVEVPGDERTPGSVVRGPDEDRAVVDALTRRWIAGGLDIHSTVKGVTTAEFLAVRGDHVNLGSVLRLGGKMRPGVATRLLRDFGPRDPIEMFDLLLGLVDDLDGPDPNPDGVRNTVLQDLLPKCTPDMLGKLLKRGADIHKRNAFEKDAFAWLFQQEPVVDWEHVEALAELLVHAGADVNTRDLWGQTPLWTAVHRGDATAFRTLVRLGADAEIPSELGVYPIDLAFFAMQFVDDEYGEERRSIYQQLGPLTRRTPRIKASPIQFATDNWFSATAELLQDPHSGWNGRDRARHAEILTAARRQRLSELQDMWTKGAPFAFIDAPTGHTPLTACLSGWAVPRSPGRVAACLGGSTGRGIPGCATKRQVAAFLLKRCPELARIPTAACVSPMRCIETHVPQKTERRELEKLLARYIE